MNTVILLGISTTYLSTHQTKESSNQHHLYFDYFGLHQRNYWPSEIGGYDCRLIKAITHYRVPGSAASEAIDPDNEDHESYLSKFKNKVTDKLRLLIEAHITNDPDVIKGRKKTVQVSLGVINTADR